VSTERSPYRRLWTSWSRPPRNPFQHCGYDVEVQADETVVEVQADETVVEP